MPLTWQLLLELAVNIIKLILIKIEHVVYYPIFQYDASRNLHVMIPFWKLQILEKTTEWNKINLKKLYFRPFMPFISDPSLIKKL